MKKILLIFTITLLFTSAFAGGTKIISGNKDVLKETVSAVLEFDYANAKWEKKESYKDKFGEKYDENIKLSVDAFKNAFNNISKGLKLTDDADSKYKMVFIVENIEQHQGGGMWGRMYWAITGQINVVDLSTQNVVLNVKVDRIDGNGDYTVPGRIDKSFSEVAIKLVNIKK